MTHPLRDRDPLANPEMWPDRPVPAADFHQRLTVRLMEEAVARRKTRVIRIMRLYWLAAASAALFIVYRLPADSAGLGTLLLAGVGLVALLLFLAPRAVRVTSPGELFLTTIED